MLRTSSLRLRELRDADIAELHSFMSDAKAMQYTYVAQSIEQCATRLRKYEALRGELGFAPWVVLREADARVIGWGGLCVDPEDPGWGMEVIYAFDPGVWGLGFATELVELSIVQAFLKHHAPELHAFAMPQNASSIRVLEKCGFSMLRHESALERNHYTVTPIHRTR